MLLVPNKLVPNGFALGWFCGVDPDPDPNPNPPRAPKLRSMELLGASSSISSSSFWGEASTVVSSAVAGIDTGTDDDSRVGPLARGGACAIGASVATGFDEVRDEENVAGPDDGNGTGPNFGGEMSLVGSETDSGAGFGGEETVSGTETDSATCFCGVDTEVGTDTDSCTGFGGEKAEGGTEADCCTAFGGENPKLDTENESCTGFDSEEAAVVADTCTSVRDPVPAFDPPKVALAEDIGTLD